MHYIPVWSAPEVQNFTAEKSYKATTKVTKLRNFVTFTEKGLLRKSYRVMYKVTERELYPYN